MTPIGNQYQGHPVYTANPRNTLQTTTSHLSPFSPIVLQLFLCGCPWFSLPVVVPRLFVGVLMWWFSPVGWLVCRHCSWHLLTWFVIVLLGWCIHLVRYHAVTPLLAVVVRRMPFAVCHVQCVESCRSLYLAISTYDITCLWVPVSARGCPFRLCVVVRAFACPAVVCR